MGGASLHSAAETPVSKASIAHSISSGESFTYVTSCSNISISHTELFSGPALSICMHTSSVLQCGGSTVYCGWFCTCGCPHISIELIFMLTVSVGSGAAGAGWSALAGRSAGLSDQHYTHRYLSRPHTPVHWLGLTSTLHPLPSRADWETESQSITLQLPGQIQSTLAPAFVIIPATPSLSLPATAALQ